MVDVRLLYPREKLEAAARLAEAIEAAGYSVEREALADAGAFPELAAMAAGANVLLLIWSRGLVTAAMNGGLAEARRHPNLVEVSVDGIEPGVGGEVSPVVLLSGWRGQPFHLGWQRILADIKRLSGSREAPRKTGTAARPVSARGGAPGSGRGSGTRRTGLRVAVAAGALAVATLGAATALDWGGPSSGGDKRAAPATARADSFRAASTAAPAPEETLMPVQSDSGTAASDAPPVAIGESTGPVQTAALDASDAASAPTASNRSLSAREPAAVRTGPRRKSEARGPGSKLLARASEPQVKRYSRKYSKTMRLFCQRSGGSTPQCRTFVRSQRDQRS